MGTMARHVRAPGWPRGRCLLCDAPGGAVPNLCVPCHRELPRVQPRNPRVVVALRYRQPVPYLVHLLKFHGSLAAGLTLGELLARSVEEALRHGAAPDVIVPVPLHRRRLRERGYNQAVELARPIAARLGIPLVSRACARVRSTPPQAGSGSTTSRRRNVAGAFRLREGALDGCRSVALVDDVLTTGATARELARTLRAGGVSRVLVWACAGPSG